VNRLSGKVAIVTGTGSGIGRAICLAFAGEGARVACADIDLAGSRETVAGITKGGGAAISLECDVSSSAAARDAVERTFAEWGRLDVLVNNAAYFPQKARITDLPEEQWHRAMLVNVSGVFLMSRHAIPRMAASGGGSIIHIASQMGRVADRLEAAYCTTKGALLNLAKAMAVDHAVDGIRVNTLSPGGIATESMAVEWGSLERAEREWGQARHPIGRLGKPEEIAAAAVFLASSESSFMTGTDLLVDGGFTAL
jgi:NAD(P)-dependent dehydrogenase (short-subunit alcohol dehydrogenase family)